MNRNDFILPVSMIKVQEKKLLSEDKLIKMLETNSFKEILRILNDTDYSYSIATITRDDEYEKIINGELERVFKFTREISKNNQEIVDLAALKYEYQNLKLLLKDKGNILDEYNISTGIIDKEEIMNNFNEVKKYKDLKEACIELDKMYLKHLLKLAISTNIPLFIDYSKISIDRYNVLTFLRLKKQNRNVDYLDDILVDGGNICKEDLIKSYFTNTYLPLFKKKIETKSWETFEKNEDILEIEKVFDNMIISLVKEYKNVTIGPEPIFTYIIAKEYEFKALRLIMSAKLNDIDIELVKSRLRGVYV
jgi:ATP synthase, subunit C